VSSSFNFNLYADESSALAQIFKDCQNKTPEERAAYLEISSHIESAHFAVAQTGQSQVPSSDDEVDLHFSCFVPAKVDGVESIVELDGRRPGPINHGQIYGNFLESAVDVVKKYIELSKSIQFNLIALTKLGGD